MWSEAWFESLDQGERPLLEAAVPPQRLAVVDCNQFYVSCERLFRPDLRFCPLVVLSNNDGCVVSRSAEAKALGVKMGQPWFEIKHLPGLKAFSSNYALYDQLSQRVMAALDSFGLPLEIYSIDEAFVQLPWDLPVLEFSQAVAERVERWSGIPVSVGVGSTKTLAKAGCYLAKNVFKKSVAWLNQPEQQLQQIPVDALWGIGRRLGRKLRAVGIETADRLVQQNPAWVRQVLFLPGLRLQQELQGKVCYPLKKGGSPRHQICHARSLERETGNYESLSALLCRFVQAACEKLRAQGSRAGKVTVFLQTHVFREDAPRHFPCVSQHLLCPQEDTIAILNAAQDCLKQAWKSGYAYKKIGVILQDLVPAECYTLSWLENPDPRREKLWQTVDAVNRRWGKGTLFLAHQKQPSASTFSRQEHRSQRYTSHWSELPRVRA